MLWYIVSDNDLFQNAVEKYFIYVNLFSPEKIKKIKFDNFYQNYLDKINESKIAFLIDFETITVRGINHLKPYDGSLNDPSSDYKSDFLASVIFFLGAQKEKIEFSLSNIIFFSLKEKVSTTLPKKFFISISDIAKLSDIATLIEQEIEPLKLELSNTWETMLRNLNADNAFEYHSR